MPTFPVVPHVPWRVSSSLRIARDALLRWPRWRRKIEKWQRPVLEDQNLPAWYKSQLFNETYFLSGGGSLWLLDKPTRDGRGGAEAVGAMFDGWYRDVLCLGGARRWDDGRGGATEAAEKEGLENGDGTEGVWSSDDGGGLDADAIVEEEKEEKEEEDGKPGPRFPMQRADPGIGTCRPGDVGHFLYLEGHEYFMYNTYDVHFYAGFALASLWPRLELSLQHDITVATLTDDESSRLMLADNVKALRKPFGVVPHDVGDPSGHPYVKLNAYLFQDVANWKDLGSKYVLQVCRNWKATGNSAFLAEAFPVCELVLDKLLRFDADGDGLIENGGFPDQTYDIWSCKGASAYTGGLWLAALQAAAAMAREVARRPELLVAPEWVRASLAAGECAIAGELQMNAAPRNAGEGAMEIVSQMSTQITRSVARGVGADPEGAAAVSGANIVADAWEAAKRKERAQERSYAEARAARFERQKVALAEAVSTGDVIVSVASATAATASVAGREQGARVNETTSPILVTSGVVSARGDGDMSSVDHDNVASAALLEETRAAALKSAERYERLLEKGRIAYEDKLWTDEEGGYFKYDTSNSAWNDSIMADQLAGHWYSRACGLGGIVSLGRGKETGL